MLSENSFSSIGSKNRYANTLVARSIANSAGNSRMTRRL